MVAEGRSGSRRLLVNPSTSSSSPSEEINAWESYGETARSARTLTRRHQAPAPRRRSSVVPIDDQPKKQSSQLGLIPEDKIGSKQQQQRFDASWSGIFDHLDPDTIQGDVQDDDVEGQLTSFKGSNLSTSMLRDVREIFGVYFEGTYSADSLTLRKRNKTKSPLIRLFNGTMAWSQPYLQRSCFLPDLWIFVELCFRGVAQVVFQNNPLSGLLILVGLFLQSTRVAVHGVVSLVCGNLLAYALGFDRGLIRSGLFGYNSILVGLALATFQSASSPSRNAGYNAATMMASVVLASFSSVVFVVMGKLLVPFKSPPLTFPFNLSTLLYLLATAEMGRVAQDPVRAPMLPDYDAAMNDGTITVREFFEGMIRGVGQIFLADRIESGILIWIGMMVCSRISAVSALVGSAIGAATALITGMNTTGMIVNGLYGFNSSLTFTAMLMFYAPSFGAVLMGVLASIMTALAQQTLSTLLLPWGLPFMTLPFCVVALPFIILQGTTNLVVAVPLASMTIPEDHWKRVRMLTDGFGFLRAALHHHQNVTSDATTTPNKLSRKTSRQLTNVSRAIHSSSSLRSSSIRLDIGEPSRELEETSPTTNTGANNGTIGSRPTTRATKAWNEDWVLEAAPVLYDAMDQEGTGKIRVHAFTAALRQANLTDPEGLHFARLVFNLIDLDRSGTMELDEFNAFCMVSRALYGIRHKIAKFFDFVDVDASDSIELEEIDMALEYLGQPVLSEEDRDSLSNIARQQQQTTVAGIDDGDAYGIDVVGLINYVTAATVKALVEEYHRSK